MWLVLGPFHDIFTAQQKQRVIRRGQTLMRRTPHRRASIAHLPRAPSANRSHDGLVCCTRTRSKDRCSFKFDDSNFRKALALAERGADAMTDLNEARRRFMTYFASVGLGTTLAPGVVWARMQDAGTQTITLAMITEALKLSGIELTEAERKTMVDSANQNLKRYDELRAIHIPNDVSPPFHFSAIVPGMTVSRKGSALHAQRAAGREAARQSRGSGVLAGAAVWPSSCGRGRSPSLELTDMYLARLHRYNGLLNNVVTFLDDHGRAEARRADAENRRGPLQGAAARHPVGCQGHHLGRGVQDDMGIARLQGSIVRLRRQRGGDAA